MIKDPVGADSDSEFARLLASGRQAMADYQSSRDRYWLTRHYVALSTLVTFVIAALDDPAAAMPARAQAAALRANQADLAAATFVDLQRPDTRTGVLTLEAGGLLAPGRALAILDAPITPEERPL